MDIDSKGNYKLLKNRKLVNKKVLIIEDDFDLLWMIKKTLTLNNYSVLTAVTGQEAIEIFSRHLFEIGAVILDLTLPDITGEEMVREIFKVVPDMPVVITTGSEDRHQQKLLFKAGITEYLIKPFDLAKLIKVLNKL